MFTMHLGDDDNAPPANPQSIVPSQVGSSSFSTAPHQNSGRCRSHRWNHGAVDRQAADRGPEDSEYHFYETSLGFFESYFAESVQNLCTFASRNNPGRLLSESPEPPEPDITDDNDDVIVVHEDDESISGCAKKRKEDVGFEEPDHFGSTTVVAASSGRDEVQDEAIEDLTLENPVRRLAYDDFSSENTMDSVEEDGDSAKAVYIPDDDLFKNRWFSDPWNRPPGQIWTKEIQNQHNLATAIRQRGFTGRRAAWLFNQLRKRKGYRFPYQERASLKRPDQTPAQYLAALRKRREEEHSYENQVKEYDEEKAVEECEWTLDLFNKVYGPEWPEAAAKAISSEADQTLAEDYTDGHEKEEERTMETRQKTRKQSSRPDSPKRKKSTAANHGITLASADQMASPHEIAKRNRDFRSYKASKIEAARVQREKEDVRQFMQSVNRQTFSNGHKEM